MRRILIEIVDYINGIMVGVLKTIFFFLPVKSKRIVFINFNGKGYGCNPKYICENLRKSDDLDLIWLVSGNDKSVPKDVKSVKYNSIYALVCVATANIIITNTKNDLRFIKKKGQKVIQTWHGSYSPKFLEKAAELSKKYKKESKKNSKQTDYFLSNSKKETQEYIDNFWCECEILEVGFPRNDVLFQRNRDKIDSIKNSIGVKNGNKLLLYAPTFRDNYDTSAYISDLNKLKHELDNLGNKWTILVRLHPNAEKYANIYAYNEGCINVTSYPDMQELLLVTDVLITDYSSSMFDFSILNKPVFLYATDIKEYTEMRGLKTLYYSLPFSISTDEDNLIDNIRNFSAEVYKEKVDNYMKEYGNFDDGHATERVCELIKSLLI